VANSLLPPYPVVFALFRLPRSSCKSSCLLC